MQVYKATANEQGAGAKGWFVCAIINGDAAKKFFNKTVNAQSQLGLVEGHAYSVLDARKVSGGARSARDARAGSAALRVQRAGPDKRALR